MVILGTPRAHVAQQNRSESAVGVGVPEPYGKLGMKEHNVLSINLVVTASRASQAAVRNCG